MNETQKPSKAKALVSGSLLFLSLFILTVNFQNCSGLSSANFGSESNTDGERSAVDDVIPVNPGGPTDPTDESLGLTAEFSIGDTFNGQTLVSANSFLDSLISRVGYVTYSGGKAIAVAENGLGYSALTDGSVSEAGRMAIESCNLLTGDDCALIVSGNTFVISKINLLSSMEYRLDSFVGRSFVASEIPMASESKRNTATVRNFMNAPGNSALAVSITGGLFSAFTTTNELTADEASRMAVQRCELESALTPCILYAVNERVEFTPRTWVKRTSVNFSNNNVLALPPPASRNSSLEGIETLVNDPARTRYGIAITPNGFGYFGRHETDTALARTEAMNACAAGVHSSRCILYASSAGVDLTPDAMFAKSDFSSLFCKTPRNSCSDHLAMGCASGGQYWVQDSSSFRSVLRTCGQ